MPWTFQIGGMKAGKLKTQCQLGSARIKLLRNKKQVQLKILRREIADLLKAGKDESAAIRVETVLREEALLRAFDLLELYLELISVRAGVLEKVGAGDAAPPDMQEALSSTVYAAPRLLDVPELAGVKHQIQLKFGSEYTAEAADDATAGKWQVNDALKAHLAVDVPAPAAKAAALAAIAAEFKHPFDEAKAAAAMAKGARQPKPPPGGGGGGGTGVTTDEFENAAGAAAAAREAADRAERAAGAASRLAAAEAVPADRAALPSPPASKAAPKVERAAEPPLPAAVPQKSGSDGTAAAKKPAPVAPEESSATSAPPPPPTDAELDARVDESVDSVAAAPAPPPSKPVPTDSSSSLGLPPAPHGGGGGGTVAKPTASMDEADELARRLAELKKS